jgi:hypothetical protein
MDRVSGGNGTLDGFEELDEFLVALVRNAAPDDPAVKHVERGEQGCRGVALVVVRHRPAFALLQRETGLGSVESLDLVFLSIETTTAWAGGPM